METETSVSLQGRPPAASEAGPQDPSLSASIPSNSNQEAGTSAMHDNTSEDDTHHDRDMAAEKSRNSIDMRSHAQRMA